MANTVNKDYENPRSNMNDKINNKMDEVKLMKKMMFKINLYIISLINPPIKIFFTP